MGPGKAKISLTDPLVQGVGEFFVNSFARVSRSSASEWWLHQLKVMGRAED